MSVMKKDSSIYVYRVGVDSRYTCATAGLPQHECGCSGRGPSSVNHRQTLKC